MNDNNYSTKQFFIDSPESYKQVADFLFNNNMLQTGKVFLLEGVLGSGKTFFVQYIVNFLRAKCFKDVNNRDLINNNTQNSNNTNIEGLKNIKSNNNNIISSSVINAQKNIIVNSPTFNLYNIYTINNMQIVHSDLYRLNNSLDILELGLLDYLYTSITFIEWPNLILEFLKPFKIIYINLELLDNNIHRNLTLKF